MVDTLAPSHIAETSSLAGAAAVKAEAAKVAKYTDLSRTHIFVPLAFETMGSWGQQCMDFVKELGRRLVTITGEKREATFLTQRISLAIQRGNATAC